MKITIEDARTSVTLQQRDFRVTLSGARGPAGPAGPAGANEWGEITGDIEDQTDLYNALQARVPYTGATADVNLGEYGAQLGNLEFDNTPTNVPTAAGSVYWNDTDGTLNMVLKGGQTISRIGETQHIRALNNTGAQIARGKVVYVVGAQGQRLTIALADADTEILSKDTIGFTSEAIADGAEGFVIVQGVINNISTTGMTDGATVYLSQTPGSYTTTAPVAPAHLVILGFIVNGGSGGAGSIYVKVDNGYELEELHNVIDAAKVTPVAADALFLRDSADNNLWKRLTWTNALAGVKTHMDTFKSVAGGYASLDGSGKVPSNELPSYVDDVVEVANYAALPVTGETGKIYVAIDTNKCYRWSGTVYVQVAQGVDTLTTTGTSGAATLVGTTLNIPQYQSVLTNPVTGTGTAGQVSYWSGTGTQTGSANLVWDPINNSLGIGGAPLSNRRLFVAGSSRLNDLIFGAAGNAAISNTSNLILNLTAATGLGISSGSTLTATAMLHVRGSGTTSATTALLVQNNDATPARLMSVRDDGRVYIGSQADTQAPYFAGYTGTSPHGPSQRALAIVYNGGAGNRPNPGVLFTASSDLNWTSNTGDVFQTLITFNPTSGTGVMNSFLVQNTINQTGGANGITRGLYVSPILTAAADWRSIEWSNTTGRGLYGSGAATNNIQGDTGIGLLTTPSAKFHVRGSGTTSATTALLVQNSTPSALLTVRDDGVFNLGSSATPTQIFPFSAAFNTPLVDQRNLQFFSNVTTQSAVAGAFYFTGLDFSQTANNQILVNIGKGFAPTSGTATFSNIVSSPTINQTGGANGITRGLYVNPTLTAAADWRSVEWSNNTGWGLYGAGTANNYLGGSLGIGTATLNNSALRINRAVTGSTIVSSISNASTINSDVTSNAWMYVSGPSTQAATFNLSELVHFNAFNLIIGTNSTITNQSGFSVSSNIIGATNNYGFRGQIASGTGRWNLYMDGTAANYLAGNTSIGTTTSGGRLTVRGETTTSASNGLLVEDSAGTDTFTVRNDGGYAFKGGTVGVAQTGYTTFTNLVTDRTCDANATTVEELADILGTLIEDLKTKGIISA